MRQQVAHARGLVVAGLLALATAAPAARAADVDSATAPSRVFGPLRPTGNDLSSQKLRGILYADRWNRARSLFELGDYQAAGAYYMALVNEPIDSRSLYEVRFRLGECLYHVGAYPGAVKYFSQVRDADPNGKYAAVASARLTELAARMGAIEQARRDFDMAGARGVQRSRAAYSLGHALAPVAATEAAQYLALVEPDTRYYPEARYHLGALAAAEEGGYPYAASYFTEAREALPAAPSNRPGVDVREQERIPRLHSLISLSLARVHADAGEYLRALVEYDNVVAGSAYRDAALLESAWVQLRLDEVLPALKNVQTLLRELPESPRVLEAALLIGYLSIEQGQFNDAYGHFEDTRRLMESLDAQLVQYAARVSDPQVFYSALVENQRGNRLPSQIATWVQEGRDVKSSNILLDEVREVEREIRDLYRQLDEVEVMAAGPRSGPGDPAWNDSLVRLEVSNALYRLQQKILLLRLRPFLSHVSPRESEILRTIRRVRQELISIRYTPSDINTGNARRQTILSQLAQYLLQIHPEIGLDTSKGSELERIAEVERPLPSDEFLRDSRRNLAELSRETTLDDRWIDAAIEYTVYLEDRLHGAIFRRLRVDERYDFLKHVSVLFRQSVELQHTLRDLGNTLADIQEELLLDIRARANAERTLIVQYQEVAREIQGVGTHVRGLVAQQEYSRINTNVAETAVMADLGALDTGWRVKELENAKALELLAEKQDRLGKLRDYYADVVSTSVGAGPYDGVENLNPTQLAQDAGSVDSPYGRELLTLSREVVDLAKALQLARMQQEKLEGGAEAAVLTPAEAAANYRAPVARPIEEEGIRIQLESEPVPGGTRGLPVQPQGGRP